MTKNDYTILMCSTNDLDNPFCSTNNYIQIIDDFLKRTTNTNIIVSCIPYRYDKTDLNQQIHEINLKLRALIFDYNHVQYLSLQGFNTSHYNKYGLHLNGKGKHEFKARVKPMIFNSSSLNAIPVIISQRPSYENHTSARNTSINNNFLDRNH